jgi:hypothetical protein
VREGGLCAGGKGRGAHLARGEGLLGAWQGRWGSAGEGSGSGGSNGLHAAGGLSVLLLLLLLLKGLSL